MRENLTNRSVWVFFFCLLGEAEVRPFFFSRSTLLYVFKGNSAHKWTYKNAIISHRLFSICSPWQVKRKTLSWKTSTTKTFRVKSKSSVCLCLCLLHMKQTRSAADSPRSRSWKGLTRAGKHVPWKNTTDATPSKWNPSVAFYSRKPLRASRLHVL